MNIFSKIISFVLILVSILYLNDIYYVNIHANVSSEESFDRIQIKDKYKILIYHNNGIGDLAQAQKTQETAIKKGWDVLFISKETFLQDKEKIQRFNPDFTLIYGIIDPEDEKQIKQLSKEVKGNIYPIMANFKKRFAKSYQGYDAYIIYDYKNLSKDVRRNYSIVMKNENIAKPFIYLTYNDSIDIPPYQEPNFKNLVLMGTRWDKLRNSQKYTDFISMLGKQGYLKIYGPESYWQEPELKLYNHGFSDDFAHIFHENGMALVLHAGHHFKNHMTSQRIVEPAAFGAVMICDDNPKVRKYFGDSVLYFDHTKSAKIIFETIDQHVKWIMANPKKARAMSLKAYNIVNQYFSMEKQLDQIAKMHEYVLRHNGNF